MMRHSFIVVGIAAWIVATRVSGGTVEQRGGGAASRPEVAFESSDNCLACHNGLTTPGGEDVSIGIAWRASMMANSARDPYWQAAVRRETIDHASSRDAIEDECATCHMPMARAAAHAAGRRGEVFTMLSNANTTSDEHRLATDGVSCALCHQIGPDHFGTRESFVGGFVIQPTLPHERRMFGPFDVTKGRASIMRSAARVTPGEASHVRESELCATCHTLYTEALGPSGEVIGSLPEQMPYLEWRHSDVHNDRSCQACHMPSVESTRIASVASEPRDYLARHTFLGGNFFMLRMLNRFRAELAVAAPAVELDATAQRTIRQLESETAGIAIARAERRESRLDLAVAVRNLTGHKLPTGYPSRRVWVHLSVRDRNGIVIFESGAVTDRGAIVGNDNDVDATRFEPHYEAIDRGDEVQIYESVMGDVRGNVTTGLLRATAFLKDNRLLPRGFEKATADSDIAVRGAAIEDPDFVGEGDRVRYAIDVGAAAGPFAIDVELRYQPIGFRWADNLRAYDAAEPRRFVSFFDRMAASSSAVLAHAMASVP